MKKIIAFGNPLLDTVVIINNDSLLKKYDLKADGQKEISQKEMALLKEDIKNYEKSVSAGGCAQNTLKVLQWLVNKQCSVKIVGGAGNDEEGKTLKEILANHGVGTHYIIHDVYSTGTTIALVNGDKRSLVAYLGAAEVISLNDIQENSHLLSQMENADLIYMEGFFLTKRTEVASFVLKYCNSLNKEFAFNLSGEYLCKENHETVKYFMERSSIIFGNKKEFEALVSTMNENNVESLVTNLSRQGKIVAMTNGSSSILCIGDGRDSYNEVKVPILKSDDIVDTTGAGDAFVAGFLTGYLLKRPINICCEVGCYAAQEIIKRKGCTVPEHLPASNFL